MSLKGSLKWLLQHLMEIQSSPRHHWRHQNSTEFCHARHLEYMVPFMSWWSNINSVMCFVVALSSRGKLLFDWPTSSFQKNQYKFVHFPLMVFASWLCWHAHFSFSNHSSVGACISNFLLKICLENQIYYMMHHHNVEPSSTFFLRNGYNMLGKWEKTTNAMVKLNKCVRITCLILNEMDTYTMSGKLCKEN